MVGSMDLFRLGLGVISIWGGVSALNRGLSHLGAGLGRANGGSQTKVIKRRKRTLPTIHRGRHVQTSAGPVRVTLKSVGSLDDRLEAIMENAEKGKFDPEVIAWARKELTKKCGGGWNGEQWCVKEKDTEAEILAIFKALRRDVRYTSDILGADTYMHPRITKKTMSADCDDFSAFGCAALMSVGIPCRFKVIQTKNSNTPDHIFIQAGTPKDGPRKWIPLDASVPMPPGWEAPKHMVSKEWIYEF